MAVPVASTPKVWGAAAIHGGEPTSQTPGHGLVISLIDLDTSGHFNTLALDITALSLLTLHATESPARQGTPANKTSSVELYTAAHCIIRVSENYKMAS